MCVTRSNYHNCHTREFAISSLTYQEPPLEGIFMHTCTQIRECETDVIRTFPFRWRRCPKRNLPFFESADAALGASDSIALAGGGEHAHGRRCRPAPNSELFGMGTQVGILTTGSLNCLHVNRGRRRICFITT